MHDAYLRIFRRLGLEAFAVDADPGAIGGSGSHEFMVAADVGEDTILFEPGCGYAANLEKASSRLTPPLTGDQEPIRPMQRVETPDIRTCEQLHAFFPAVPVYRMVKTLIVLAVYADREELWAVLMRGDQEVNEIKLQNRLGALTVRMASDREVIEATGAEPGFAGPVGLPSQVRVLADESVRGMRNVLCGVNTTGYHALDVNFGVDFPEPQFADVRLARAGEPCVVNGEPLQQRRGIEVGHIFKLGTKYSAAMKATFMDRNGTERPYVMGCYGIGVSRVAAATIEQCHDTNGIVWPVSIAPYEVAVIPILPSSAAHLDPSMELYRALRKAGIDVLLDERDTKAGVRLKDADLIGFPYTVVVGREFESTGRVEVKRRDALADVRRLTIAEAVEALVAEIQERRTSAPLER
jgi:prolyl-tRNA synthetase